MDVVIDAEQVALQLHESVGHPTELDRVLGFEAAYAGTSFLQPERPRLASLRLRAHERHGRPDDAAAGSARSASTTRACRREPQPIVREGVLVGWLGSREVGFPGSMRADGWSRMPLVRMTNLHLEPGEGSLEELIAGVESGLYLETNKSWSIDDKRLNFQFGTQVAWEIVDGKLGRMFRDATYTGITPQFWGSMDAVAGRDEWRLHGLTNCGKGQPGQVAHVSHGTCAGPLPRRPGRSSRVRTRSSSRAARSSTRPRPPTRRRSSSTRSARASRASPASTQHQPTLVDDTVVTLRAVRDGRVGVAVTNRTSDDGLRELAARAADAAERVRADPDFPGLAAAGRAAATSTATTRRRPRSARTSRRGSRPPRSRRPATRPRTASSRAASTELAVASTTGLEASQRMTDATVLVLAAAEGASGLRDADVVGGRRASIPRRARPRPRRRRRGRAAPASSSRASYRAVLEPYALAELLAVLRLGLVRRRSGCSRSGATSRDASASASSTRR